MKYSNYIVIIPARKDSKRLKGKNTKLLRGKPLICYSIEYALKYFPKKNIWVNTNDKEIISLANTYKINFYKRKESLCQDKTSSSDVVLDQIKFLKQNNFSFQSVILLQPTNPLRNNLKLKEVINFYNKNNLNSLMTVTPVKYKLGKISKSLFNPINYSFHQRSQNINQIYFENGQLYISKIEVILERKTFITEDVYPYITDGIESYVDIDNQEDFDLAKLILTNDS